MHYAELHCKTNFSFLEGASHAEELVAQAALLEYAALAVTDRNSLAGVVRAHMAAKDLGLPLIIGAEITPTDAPPIVLWATDRKSYGRLSRLITIGRRRAAKGECELKLEDIARLSEGLIAGVVLNAECGMRNAEWKTEDEDSHILPFNSAFRIPHSAFAFKSAIRNPESEIHTLRDIFSSRLYLLASLHRGPDDEALLEQWLAVSQQMGIPLVASGDVHYHIPARKVLHDVLTATRFHTTVAEAGERLFPNAQRHLMPLEKMAAAFRAAPEALARTIEIAEQCRFSLDELKYEYPEELAPPGKTPLEHLIDQTWTGARDRYPFGIPDRVRGLIEHELQLIAELRYEAYFLTVWDLVRFARGRGILCQGRGSAANSAVCYCLGVTSVDPSNMDVLFERFISKERNEAPDIDVDFEHERREEVLQYLYEKYSRERAGMTGVVITYRSRSAIRDAGKALGLSLDRVDALAKNAEGYVHEPRLGEHCKTVGIDPDSDVGKRLIYVVNELIGFPRHLSQHVGGMVMTQGPLCELAPIENAAMEGRTVIEWDKDDLDELGILKVDVLALGMLSAIRKCFELVQRHHCRALTLANIPQDDPQVYDMICKADTMGVFQIESRAQMSMLPRLRPRCYYDLVIEVAIVRPGPIQGNMVHPYLKRRQGEAVPEYPTKEIAEVLHKTLGVPIFQEQAMRLAVVAAGFTPGEADQLRRAMAAWRRPGIIDQFQEKLMKGMKERGLSEEFAQNVFTQIRGFGEYGFPESHAASFALLVYVSSYLKCYYPSAFCAALINSQPMGFYAPAQLVRDAREHGVEVLPVDVNYSEWNCTLVGRAKGRRGGGEKGRREEGSGVRGQGPGRERREEKRAECDARSEETEYSVLSTQYSVLDAVLSSDCSAPFAPSPLRPSSLPPDPWPLTPDPSASSAPSPLPPFSPPLRLGFRLLVGFPEAAANTIVAERERGGPFQSLAEFATRTKLSPALVAKLSDADAFASLGRDRRAMLWESLAQDKHDHERGLFDRLDQNDEPPVELPPLAPEENVRADYRTTGMSLKAHPIGFHRQALNKLHVTRASDLPHMRDQQHLRVAGLVILRQRPSTAKGITFVTLEDETGIINLILKQEIWQRNYLVARRSPAWIAHGQLQTRDGVTHVLVNRLDDLSKSLGGVAVKSRDFR